MGKTLMALFLSIGGLIRILDMYTNTYYIISEKFKNSYLLILSIVTLLLPSVFLAVWLRLLRSNSKLKKQFRDFYKLRILWWFVLFDLFGICYIVIEMSLITQKKSKKLMEFYEIFIKVSSAINAVLQTMPFLIIQVINNELNHNWGSFQLICALTTGSNLCFAYFALIFSFADLKAPKGKVQPTHGSIFSKEPEIFEKRGENQIDIEYID